MFIIQALLASSRLNPSHLFVLQYLH